MSTKRGTVYPKGTVIPVVPVAGINANKPGEPPAAKDAEPNFYVGFDERSGLPAVISRATDQIFLLDWSDILIMALEAGVDEIKLAEPETPKLILPG